MEKEPISKQIKEKLEDVNPYREEGRITKAIEAQTSKIPSDVFLLTAGGLMLGSLTLKLLKKDQEALFLGQWVAPVLIMGLYNKLVKVHGHDQLDNTPT
jgi:hypothetical protein